MAAWVVSLAKMEIYRICTSKFKHLTLLYIMARWKDRNPGDTLNIQIMASHKYWQALLDGTKEDGYISKTLHITATLSSITKFLELL